MTLWLHVHSSRSLRVALLLALAADVRSAFAEDWPHWRGPAASGVSTESGVPTTWSNTQNVIWKTTLSGAGVSSPIVVGDRVFVTSQAGEGTFRQGPRLGQGAESNAGERSLGRATGGAGGTSKDRSVRFLVEAFDRSTGRRQWTHEVTAAGQLPQVHDKHNLASASPVADAERVYAVFGSGQVTAVDFSGKAVWQRNLAQEFGEWDINWGNGSSPIVHNGALIVVSYNPSAPYLIALEGRTGRTQWKVDRPKGVTSYSTPLVVPAPEGHELVVNSSLGVEAYEVATGRALWHINEANQFPIPVAMFDRGLIYLSRGYRSGPYAAIKPGGRGEVSKSHVVWHVPTGAPYVSSILHYDGLIYMAGDTGIITCVDAKTGERVWRERLGGVYTASPVAAEGKIYMLSETGETLVLKAGRTPQVLARNQIDGRQLASPAIASGHLFIRTDDHILAVGAPRR